VKRKERPLTIKLLFQGEMMVCIGCDKRQKSDPAVESGWTAIQVENEAPQYVCPDCWQKGHFTKTAW